MKIITICGQISKYKEQYEETCKRLISEGPAVVSADKNQEITFNKIDLSDEIFVIDRLGYVDASTQKEVDYARSKNKRVRFYSVDEIG